MLASVTPGLAHADWFELVTQREARLRPEAAHLYPWIRPGEWQPAAILADRILAGRLLRGHGALIVGRELVEAHFDFRGGDARAGERTALRPRREDR
jgi:hypothetical protein